MAGDRRIASEMPSTSRLGMTLVKREPGPSVMRSALAIAAIVAGSGRQRRGRSCTVSIRRRLRLIYLPSKELPPSDDPLVDDFILDPMPPGTIVRLLGSGIPATLDWDAQYKRLRMGWQAAMTRLKVLVERQLREE